MKPNFIVSVIAVYVVNMLLSFVQHAVLLHPDYAQLPNVMRSEQDSQAYMGYMMFGQFLISAAFVWIYQRGQENKAWLGQGIRFGIACALLSTVPHHLIYHAVAQFPLNLVIKQVLYDFPVMIAMGFTCAFINRQK